MTTEQYKLPCAVRLPTGVTFGKGIDLDTLIMAMNRCSVAKFEDAPKLTLHLPSYVKGLQEAGQQTPTDPVNARLLEALKNLLNVCYKALETKDGPADYFHPQVGPAVKAYTVINEAEISIAAAEQQQAHPLPDLSDEPVYWLAVLNSEQLSLCPDSDNHVKGFKHKQNAESWIAGQKDFNGLDYGLQPLYTRTQSAEVNSKLLKVCRVALDHLIGETAWTQGEEDSLIRQLSEAIAEAKVQQ